jgi:hypothetical protein
MGNMKTVVFSVVVLCIVHLVLLFQRNLCHQVERRRQAVGSGTVLVCYQTIRSHPRRHNCCFEDRGSKFLWNVSTYFYVPDYPVAYPRSATSFTPKIEATHLSKILACFSKIYTNICVCLTYIHHYILEDHNFNICQSITCCKRW